VNTLRKYYRIPLSRIIRHKDVPGKNTACPGDSFPWAEFKRRLRRGR
jgi:N-acetyl-anhydromuramyl-L-alanine amidase AmpD